MADDRQEAPTVTLYGALARAAAEFQPLSGQGRSVTITTRDGRSYSYDYAPLAALIDATRPALSKYGLAVIQSPTVIGDEEPAVDVLTVLAHESGEQLERRLSLPIPVDEQGRYDARGIAGIMTYARRYAYASLLNLAYAREDDDARGAHDDPGADRATSYRARGGDARDQAAPPDQWLDPETGAYVTERPSGHLYAVTCAVDRWGWANAALSDGVRVKTKRPALVDRLSMCYKAGLPIHVTLGREDADSGVYFLNDINAIPTPDTAL